MQKTAFITGANRGIGKAIALTLAQLGYNLFLLARNNDALSQVADECRTSGNSVATLAGELSDAAFAKAAVEEATTKFGSIDVLINNAGTAAHAPVQEANLEVWQDVMAINFDAVVQLSRQLLPGMVERRSGTIINISSIMGRGTDAGSAIYSASKHALNGFSGCMFEDVRAYGIKVSTIMPGFVETDLTRDIGLDPSNMIQPDDVAASVAYVLSASAHCCPTEIVLRPQLPL